MEHKFKKPPVIEFVCALQFKDNICDLPVILSFYEEVKSDYIKITENIPYINKNDFSLQDPLKNLFLSKPVENHVRYWFHKNSNDRLIQLQNNFYALNWRKEDNIKNVFPSYHIFFNDFTKYFDILTKILKKQNKKIEIDGCEMTYVDHIYVDELGIDIGRIDEIFDYFKLKGLTEKISGFNFSYGIKLDDLGGEYSIKYHTAHHNTTKRELIVVQTSVIGKLTDKLNNIHDWFKKTNDILVDEFVLHLTDKTKEKWGYSYV